MSPENGGVFGRITSLFKRSTPEQPVQPVQKQVVEQQEVLQLDDLDVIASVTKKWPLENEQVLQPHELEHQENQ